MWHNEFENVFYVDTKYEQAIPGTIKLIPPKYRLNDLEADYNSMKDMLYGDIPSFAVVMEAVGTLEREINVHKGKL